MDEKIEATIAAPANNPEVALQEKDRSELVRRAFRLSAEHRQIIDLVYCRAVEWHVLPKATHPGSSTMQKTSIAMRNATDSSLPSCR